MHFSRGFGLSVKPEAVGLSNAPLDRLAQVIKRDVDQGRMPGAVVAIARRGKLAYYEAFGFLDKAAKVPMPKDAIFTLASAACATSNGVGMLIGFRLVQAAGAALCL